jgi:integrase
VAFFSEALHTTDRRKALALEKKRIPEIQTGKGASKTGRQFARLPFANAADLFTEQRRLIVSERTAQLDRERLRPLRAFCGDKPLLRVTAADIVAYQRARIEGSIRLKNREKGVANRTVNMEVTVLRQLLRRAKVWSALSEDVVMLPESHEIKGKVLTKAEKELLFKVAGTKHAWMVAHCAAVLAVSTTCRGVELKNLPWRDVDLFDRKISIRQSKNEDTGHPNHSVER